MNPWEEGDSEVPEGNPWESGDTAVADVTSVTPTTRSREQSFGQAALQQFDRVPAFIRGGVQGYQEGRPDRAMNLAFGGFADPRSVQTSPQMMANFGAGTEKTVPIVSTPDPRMSGLPGFPQSLQREQVTGFKSPAEGYAEVFDMFAPTGLEGGAKVAGKILGAFGKGTEAFGLKGVQASLKPSKKLRESPSPFNAENLFKSYPNAPDGLASKMGRGKTLSNIEEFHGKLGDEADVALANIPSVDLNKAIFEAEAKVAQAVQQGGNKMLGISVKDVDALKSELEQWAKIANKQGKKGLVSGKVAKNFRGSLMEAAKYDRPVTNNAERVIAASIHEEINDQLARISPEFRAIDKQFAETIPLRNAISDAMGREGNKYPIGLRTAMMIANPASIPSELGKIALIEGTSRYAPAVATKRVGEAFGGMGRALQSVPTYPLLPMTKQIFSEE